MYYRLKKNRGMAALAIAAAILAVCEADVIAQQVQPQATLPLQAPMTKGDPNNLETELITEVTEPGLEIKLDPSRSKVVRTRYPVHRIAITDPAVMDVNQFGPDEFEFIGKQSGDTSLSLWFKDQNGDEKLLRYMVRVGSDEKEQERAEVEFGRLENRINEMFPNSRVKLIPIADKLVVRGQARDSEEAAQIMALLRGGANGAGGFGQFGGGLASITGGTVTRIPGAEDLPQVSIVSLLTVPGEQQVMLKVRIAELTRTAARELGLNFQILEQQLSITQAISTGGNLSAIFDGGDINLFLKAFSSQGNGKILAEPTLVTLSGHPATFIAGGEFAVPTAVGIGGIGAASTSFRGFGTQLRFTPTVIDKDRIRLQVAPSFSALNQNNSVNGIPGLNTRAVSTTVDLREGQWLAIAGLIQDEQGGTHSGLAGFGDMPFVGGLFSNQQIKRGETELVVLVSPELVHPLECDQVPLILPGMDVTDPTNKEFFLHGQIEGRQGVDHRSTVSPKYRHELHEANWDAIHMSRQQIKMHSQFNRQQQHYISGAAGFSR